MRAAATDKEVVVRTEIRGRGDPVQLDYRLDSSGAERQRYQQLAQDPYLNQPRLLP